MLAASQGRDDVLPNDVKVLAGAVLGHRLLLTPDAMLREETIDNIVDRIVTRAGNVPRDGSWEEGRLLQAA